ncbi:MAG: 5-bromo-4-chloroindolyl phosphate hydrolysis family protein [Candidatus Gastranaerophilales bacterium]|nr:5-bromo-4-chloroindolyl phosphate hydrolysis family protein [Candidatus Gastranaerophilales bacterium]
MADNQADNQREANLGEQMKGAVTEALQSGDFSHLNDLVFSTVENTLKDAAQKVSEKAAEVQNVSKASSDQETVWPDPPVWQQRAAQREQARQQQIQQDWQRRVLEMQRKQQHLPARIVDLIKFKRVGNVSGVLYQVLGGLGVGICALAALGGLIWGHSGGGWIALGVCFLLSVCMIQGGARKLGRLRRAERYAELCGNRMYGEVGKIAANTGQSKRFVLKDIRAMLRQGIFPEGHLDEQGDWFMLNNVVYNQYQNMEESRKQRENEAKQLEGKTEEKTLGEMVSDARKAQEAELNAMIAEGMDYIHKLRDLNDKIVGEVISNKLYRLERLLNEIFNNVREHPEQMPRMHKLMDYYLPTTLKLVEAYEEFDGVSMPREDIVAAKQEIEKTLDIINQAFTELLNNLFEDAVLDITTDAQVLQTMLAQEGLTREMEFAEIARK